MHVVVIIKRKPKKNSRFSFVCWELSHVNSFSRSCFTSFRKTKTPKIFQCVSLKFFSFLWVERRRPRWKCWVALICIIVDLTKSPYYLVFSLQLNACRFQLSPMHVHYYYYPHRSVVQVKGNNDDIWWTDYGREKRVWTQLVLFL